METFVIALLVVMAFILGLSFGRFWTTVIAHMIKHNLTEEQKDKLQKMVDQFMEENENTK